ncbi:hypothetical protein EUX98_g295 [Antrodiella citrinella]|uniref:D-lactate dehydrogenase (cytochrome) n=1 Tax=Antrodiella citrinella TaxID=2447956 RepID=A0A4S4N4C3_9APHY|nr:hypothetical protein EUX98_g295 [Antrodiella citrinella]
MLSYRQLQSGLGRRGPHLFSDFGRISSNTGGSVGAHAPKYLRSTGTRFASSNAAPKFGSSSMFVGLAGLLGLATVGVLLIPTVNVKAPTETTQGHASAVEIKKAIADLQTALPGEVVTGSICVDMSGMDQIIEIHADDGDLVCQAGARWEDINQALHDKGIPLFFPLDPGPGATIGGMIGTGCSGTNAVRYGTARGEWFLNVTVVLPNGKVIKTRRRARKSAAGFDTTQLFIGAEGTLGIVTEATLRLAPVIPTKVAVAQFPTVQNAVNAVQEILNSPDGPHIQCVELLDNKMMEAINAAGLVSRPYPVSDSLFLKLQGTDISIKQTAGMVQQVFKKHGSYHFEFAATEEEAAEMWENRKYALMSTISAGGEGARVWTTDVCVPVSRLPELVYETKKDLESVGLDKTTIVGHVGDGNFHALIVFNSDEQLPKVSDAVHRLVHRAIALDGTCTGEHGIGVGKKEYMYDELSDDTVELMKTIKAAIDPLDIMNPDKLYPDKPADRKH